MTALTHCNPIREYYEAISSGEIVAPKKVIAVYQHLVDNLDNPGQYHYDSEKADRVIKFVETYCHPSKGKAAKYPLKLMLWQKAFIAAAFGFVDDAGLRQYKEVALIIGRKNGKSALSSAISLYLLFKDGELGPEVYAAATKKDQAKRIWDESVKMVKKSPALRKRCKTLVGSIVVPGNDGEFKPLSRDSNTMDGLNVSAALMDEIHAWTDQNLFDVIRDGMSSRDQPITIITTTAGTVRDSVYDKRYEKYSKIINGYSDEDGYCDERTLPIIYELDSADEVWNEDMWIKANPGLGVIKKRSDIREKVAAAKEFPEERINLLTKDFGVIQSSTVSYFEMSDLNFATFDVEALKPDYFIGGFDLSRVMDLTSAAALFQVPNDNTIYVMSMSWMPEDALQEHKHDNVPYQTWIDQGYIRLCPGNVIDDNMVCEWFRELREEYDMYMFRCGFDRYSATHLQQEMAKTFGERVLVPVAQGTKTLSLPMETSKAWLQQKKINYGNNPVLNWALLNTEAKVDTNGGIQPAKDRSLNKRIDPYAAMLDALTVYLDNLEAYTNRIN